MNTPKLIALTKEEMLAVTTPTPLYMRYHFHNGDEAFPIVGATDVDNRFLAMTLGKDNTPHAIAMTAHTYGSYDDDHWELYRIASFEVNTPDGTLLAYAGGDTNYPGVMVDLLGKDTVDGKDIGLAMVEYIPGNDEAAQSDPKWTPESERERAEVPDDRLRYGPHGEEVVSAGFVTRAWANGLDEETHTRTFHYNYRPASEDALNAMLGRAYAHTGKHHGAADNIDWTSMKLQSEDFHSFLKEYMGELIVKFPYWNAQMTTDLYAYIADVYRRWKAKEA